MWDMQPIVSLSLLANDGYSQWQIDTGRDQTILQSKKGLERSLAPALPTDRITFKPFHMEKGVTKSLSPFSQEGLKFQNKLVNKSRGLRYVTSGLKSQADTVREAGRHLKSVTGNMKTGTKAWGRGVGDG